MAHRADALVEEQTQMAHRADALVQEASETLACLDQADMLTAELRDLEVRVTAEVSPSPPGIALSVTITRSRSGRHATGILVILDSENEPIDQLTDARGRVVFPPVRGRVTLQLGHSAFSLDLTD